jgi:hypothetical protein
MQGILGNNFNWSVAYYQSYMTDPALLSVVDMNLLAVGDLHGLQMQKFWEPVQIAGGSFSLFESFTETIVRGELAWFFGEPAFQLSKNFRAIGAFLAGSPVIPPSELAKWDVLRFSVALDRPFWVRFLNPTSMFSCTLEVFNEYYPSFSDDFVLPAPAWPSGNFVELHEWEQTIVGLVYTSYMEGTLTPTVLVGVNPREGSAGFYTLSLEKRFGNDWKVKVAYDDVWGNKTIPPGVLFDWTSSLFGSPTCSRCKAIIMIDNQFTVCQIKGGQAP